MIKDSGTNLICAVKTRKSSLDVAVGQSTLSKSLVADVCFEISQRVVRIIDFDRMVFRNNYDSGAQ
jgi:hypothetical protein